ncbi:DUF2790 domain-containing protein [Pseudomonas sp. NPDC078700]|uniref:DUF2790 domain-containing protein n=1 Tax=Pseudomonas sp. NPDC078700 TaxID=3364424 RepID=UPI0037C986F4
MKSKYWLFGLAVVAQGAFSADVQQYSYGQKLDVAQIISIKAPEGCDVGEATMVYKDSNGQTHTLTYLRTGENCYE